MKAALTFLRAQIGWLILLVLVGAGAGGYYWYQQHQAAQAKERELQSLRTETLGRGDLVSLVSATGSIAPEQQVNLFFQLPGRVTEVLVESGAAVEQNQVLARLDDAELRLAVQQATDALTVAELNRQKLLAGPSASDIAIAKANLRAANAAAYDLSKGAGAENVQIAQIQYDNQFETYRVMAEQYNNTVQFAKDYPQFAPPQSALDSLKAGMESAYYAAEVARLQVEQVQQGADKGALSVAYAQIVQAQAIVSQTLAAPSALQLARADLAVAQAQTALNAAQTRLARAELRAPFAGVVALVNLKAGETTGSAPAIVLIDDSQFHLDVLVDEVDVAQLAVGQAVSITVDALPQAALSAVVDRLAPTATLVGGAVNYAVRLVLDKADEPLRAGMSATAAVTVAEVQDVLIAPNWAIRRDRRTGQAYLSVQVGETLTEAPIETGLRGESYTEILSGAKEGDLAAISTQREELDIFGGGN